MSFDLFANIVVLIVDKFEKIIQIVIKNKNKKYLKFIWKYFKSIDKEKNSKNSENK